MTNEYCRKLEGKSRECIQFVSSKEYLHVVREPDPNEPGVDRYCYEASRFLTIIDDKPQENENNTIKSTGHKCDATQYIAIAGSVTRQETLETGTRICEYSLKLQNTGDSAVRHYLYQHNKDGYQRTESFQWVGNFPIMGDISADWYGTISFHDNDKDFKGPVMTIAEKFAGIFDSAECAEYYMDEKFLESVAVPIDSFCPLD